MATAAIVDTVAAWRAPMLARMPALAPLVEGLRASRQVWTLHAEHAGQGNPEGLRRLLLALVRDLRVVLVLLARQLAVMRAATGSGNSTPSRAHDSITLTVSRRRDRALPLSTIFVPQIEAELKRRLDARLDRLLKPKS